MKRLQAADKFLGRFCCTLLQPLRWKRWLNGAPSEPRNVLLIKFWGIGSLQLLTPAVRTLRARHPSARFTLLTLNENAEFARGLQLFDDVRTLDVRSGRGVRGWARIAHRIVALVRETRGARFDRVYDFEFFTRFSALVSLAAGARETSGFAAPNVWRGGFHTRTVPFNRYWHVARNFRALAGGEDGEDVGFEDLVPYRPSPTDERSIGEQLAGIAGRTFVVLNPNAGHLSLERRWPASSFARLARSLVEEDGTPVVFIGSASESAYVRAIVAETGASPESHVIDLCGKLSIGELCTLLGKAGVIVTNDSGPMHLGAATGTPTVGLFGPETPVMYGPLGSRTTALWKPPVCSPCINVHDNKVYTCVHGTPECLVNISHDEVLEEVRLWLWDRVLQPRGVWSRRGALHVLRGPSHEWFEELPK